MARTRSKRNVSLIVPEGFSVEEILGAIARIVYRHALAEIIQSVEAPWQIDEQQAAERIANAVLRDLKTFIRAS